MLLEIAIAVGVVLMSDKTGKSDFDNLFHEYGSKYSIDWKMLKAICMIESSLGTNSKVKRGLENPNDVEGSKSFDGKSWGLMQVTIPTARDFDSSATAVKLNNPSYSVNIAAQYLKWLENYFLKYKSDPRFREYIIKSYNQGPGNMKNEIATGVGYANDYWKKYRDAYGSITGI